ncbi:allophanate hydrolase [Brevibacillus reuszeri]|uniref:Hydrolase n=1 Tax=Brevibacillus reuszeri TaxID=54915 RepID=A0A0K9YQ38_9BACL|nr:biotin-dependent carboxyltransferase family protein [Brevibacillus reuszeri]KNB70834.1 hydrolase [Brevibacillus reuszeri]MED1857223.1 biotin-dependent carboxyltransferase family protein [Brevibacillus reuszeri]GED66951.1 allophanate hydrolase [Brevibacillus reuszeri]
MLYIRDGGLQTLVQDMGRKDYYHLGVPPSGAADRYSYVLGNILLGNPVDYAALEITLLGPEIEVRKKTVIAITGAPLDVKLNGSVIPMWETICVQEGDILTLRSMKRGVKSYLCVSGGIQVPHVLGSRSTYTLSQLGGFHGRKLMAGDEIIIGEPLPGVFHHVGMRIPEEYMPKFSSSVDIRMVMGISSYRLSDEGVKAFLNSEWQVGIESNNIAYRYSGASASFKPIDPPFGAGNNLSNTVDIVYPIGAIMVPNEKELILLLRDATTGGGFVTLGTTISADLDLVAQSRPQTKTRFIAVTMEQAIEARMSKKKKVLALQGLMK